MKLAFDVGANVGKITELIMREYDEVVAIEANEALCKNLEKKFDSKINILNYAASSVSGNQLDFYISKEHTLSTLENDWMNKSRFSETSKWNAPVEVMSITLDDVIDKYDTPNLIKIDVEGHELEVLKGLSTPVDYICFKWVDEMFEKAEACVNQLQSIGFKQFALVYGEYQPGQQKQDYKLWNDLNFDTKAKKRYGMLWAHYVKGNK